MRSRAAILLGLLFFIFFASSHALADKRVALVIGNSTYAAVPKLANPEDDAAAIGLRLEAIGFDAVDVRQNLSNVEMRGAMRDFAERTKGADIAVVYFAGHGIDVGGTNYLIPVDAALKRDVDVENEAVSLESLLMLLEPAKRLRLAIMDASRENPFVPGMAHTRADRPIGRGLAKIEAPLARSLIVYSARPGQTAADGPSNPFTHALIKHLGTPDLDIRIAFGRAWDDVRAVTYGRQDLYMAGSLPGSSVQLTPLPPGMRVPAGVGVAPLPPGAIADADVQASRAYEAAANIGTADAWESFLKLHPAGAYADLAKAQLGRLTVARPDSETRTNRRQLPP